MKYYSEKFKKRDQWRKKLKAPLNYSYPSAVLDIILDFAENQTLFETPFNHLKRLNRKTYGLPEPTRWRYNRAIKYLQNQKKLKVVEKDGGVFLQLTQKGVLDGLLRKIKTKTKPSKWDGKWRLIIWDIPESSHAHRDKLRSFVKQQDFFRLQQSVFVRPYPLAAPAVKYLNESGLAKYIRFLRVDKVDNPKDLLENFRIEQPMVEK